VFSLLVAFDRSPPPRPALTRIPAYFATCPHQLYSVSSASGKIAGGPLGRRAVHCAIPFVTDGADCPHAGGQGCMRPRPIGPGEGLEIPFARRRLNGRCRGRPSHAVNNNSSYRPADRPAAAGPFTSATGKKLSVLRAVSATCVYPVVQLHDDRLLLSANNGLIVCPARPRVRECRFFHRKCRLPGGRVRRTASRAVKGKAGPKCLRRAPTPGRWARLL